MNEQQLTQLLDSKGIPYRVIRHKPVFNIEEACRELGVSPDAEVKNLLLKDDRGFFLLIAVGSTRVNYKAVAAARGTKKVRMAQADEVKEKTGVEVGSVNLFSYSEVLVDSRVVALAEINTHPDDNTITLMIPTGPALGLLKNKTVGEFCTESVQE